MSTHEISLFYSSADADEPLCLELDKHLSLMRRDGVITAFHKRNIAAGTDWTKALDSHLNSAAIILLLISVDFVASDYCYGVEMSRAMERHERGEAHVIPVLLRPIGNWQGSRFGKLQVLPSNSKPVTSWPDQDDAFVDIAEGIRAVLQQVQSLAVRLPSSTLPAIWNIPYPRNPVFTGREEILARIKDQLQAGQAMALSQAQAISGLGGIGKTQIAIEFAYQHRSDYEAVLWVLADTRESLVSGYIAVAELLNLPQKDEQDQDVIIKAVKNWLQTHSSWLLILDNADDLAMVREFVPTTFGGHILLTTRAQSMGKLAKGIEVETMDQDVGALFLLRRAGLIAEDALLDAASADDVTIAHQISEELGGLPLALDQAGAFIEESQCGLLDYQRRYRTRKAQLLKRRGGLVGDHPEPVATTWSLSFQKVEKKSALAAGLLRLCTFLHPDAIPVELIIRGAPHLGPELARVAGDEMALDDAIATLGAYSLIRRDASMNTLSVHRLVQAVQRDTINEPTRKLWAERAVLAVNAVFPEVSFETWPQCERYLSHVLVCAELVGQEEVNSLTGASLLYRAGWYLDDRARYVEAELLCRRALSIREQQLGTDHADVAASLNSLATLYWHQGRYKAAELLCKQTLAIDERVYGETHPEVATDLNNLATLYADQGEFERAEPLHQRALSIREQKLGEMHLDTAQSLNNLANLYCYQDKYADAEPLLKRALTIHEQQLGVMHPLIAGSLNNLAQLYKAQGKSSENSRAQRVE